MDAAPPFDSHPSELGLLGLLRGLVRGDEVASWMHKASVYDADPVALTARYGAATAADGDRAWYFVCKPETKNQEKDRRIRRIAGSGTWKGERRGKPVDGITHGGVRKKVGWRRTFSYLIKHKGQKDARAGWIMVELKLADGTDTSTCLYKLYRSPRIAPSALQAPTAPAPINNSPNHLLVGVSSASPAPDAAAAFGESSSGLTALISSGVTPAAAAAAAAAPDAAESSSGLTALLTSGVTPPPAAGAPDAAESSSGLTALLTSGVTPPPAAAAHAPHIILGAADTSPASPTDDATANSSPSLALSLGSGVTATAAALDPPHISLSAAEAEAVSPASPIDHTAAALAGSSTPLTTAAAAAHAPHIILGAADTSPASPTDDATANSSPSLALSLGSGVTATAAALDPPHVSLSAAEAEAVSPASSIDQTAAALAGSSTPLTTAAAAGREASPTKKWVHVQISGSPTKSSDNGTAKRVYQMIVPEEEWSAPLSAKRPRTTDCKGWLMIEPLA